MRIVKIVIAWILLVVSILGLVIGVAGIAGSWIVNGQLTSVTVNMLTAGQSAITTVNNSVIRVDERLDVTQERIDNVDNRVIQAGQELNETSLVVTLVDNLIGDEIRPIVSSISDTANTIRDTAAAIDDVLQAVNGIPFVQVDRITPGDNVFTEIADEITGIETAIEDTRAELRAKREDKIDDVVNTALSRTDQLRGRVSSAQDRLQNAQERLNTANSNLDNLKVRLARLYLLITMFINILFILEGLAFLSLLFHAISYIKNPDQTLKEVLA